MSADAPPVVPESFDCPDCHVPVLIPVPWGDRGEGLWVEFGEKLAAHRAWGCPGVTP